jgi:four helix bundle protein
VGKAAQAFEDLHIYQQASELVNSVYAATRAGAFSRDFGLADQIRRAAVSIMSNIAEGFERGGKTEFIQFLYTAKGSCGEVRAQLQVARDQQYISSPDYERLSNQCRQIGAMTSNFIKHLQQSKYQGGKVKSSKANRDGGGSVKGVKGTKSVKRKIRAK